MPVADAPTEPAALEAPVAEVPVAELAGCRRIRSRTLGSCRSGECLRSRARPGSLPSPPRAQPADSLSSSTSDLSASVAAQPSGPTVNSWQAGTIAGCGRVGDGPRCGQSLVTSLVTSMMPMICGRNLRCNFSPLNGQQCWLAARFCCWRRADVNSCVQRGHVHGYPARHRPPR